jgi:hypothetical protein
MPWETAQEALKAFLRQTDEPVTKLATTKLATKLATKKRQ